MTLVAESWVSSDLIWLAWSRSSWLARCGKEIPEGVRGGDCFPPQRTQGSKEEKYVGKMKSPSPGLTPPGLSLLGHYLPPAECYGQHPGTPLDLANAADLDTKRVATPFSPDQVCATRVNMKATCR